MRLKTIAAWCVLSTVLGIAVAVHAETKTWTGEWHTYLITKKPEGHWNGTLDTLRLDIGSAGDTVAFDWIRLYKGTVSSDVTRVH
jgi:hypothetical protein